MAERLQATKMRRILFSTVFVCALIGHLVAERKMKKTDTSAKIKPSSSKNGENRVLEIQSTTGKLRKVDLQKRPLPDKTELNTELFASADEKVICTEKCKSDKSSCVSRCMEEESVGYAYYVGDKALHIENSDTGSYYDTVPSDIFNGERAKRQTLEPNVETVGFVNVKYVVDAAFMQAFQALVGGTLMDAKQEVEFFLTLLNTRVALFIHTLNQYRIRKRRVDLTVHMNDITFPLEIGGAFSDIPPIANNTNGNNLATKDYYDVDGNYLGLGGVLAATAYYIRELYDNELTLDLVSFLTGLDLVSESYTILDDGTEILIDSSPGVLGVAFLGTFCESYENYPYDLRFQFSELYSTYTPRTVAHEIGHNLGARHDQTRRCPSNAITVMAPFVIARLEGYEQYNDFSRCSARDILNHLGSIPSGDLNQCLYSEPPSQSEFLDKFCTGLLGDRYTLDDTCKIFFGNTSGLCTYDNALLEQGFLSESDCITSYNSGTEPIFWCSNDGDCESTNYYIDHPFDGARCALGGVTGDAICFNGVCESEVQLCGARRKRNIRSASDQTRPFLKARIDP